VRVYPDLHHFPLGRRAEKCEALLHPQPDLSDEQIPMKIVKFVMPAVVVALGSAAPAAVAAQTTIKAADAWSRPVPAGLPTAVVYLTVVNSGHDPDRLIGAQTPIAAHMTLHRSTMAHGVMSMDPVPGGAEIAPGGVLKLAPGGYHLMLDGLKGGLQPGARFPATLTFAHAGAVKIEVQVRAGATAGGGAAMKMR
jgi:copper(I)-binding protein